MIHAYFVIDCLKQIINSKENFNNDPCIFCNRLFETNNKQ